MFNSPIETEELIIIIQILVPLVSVILCLVQGIKTHTKKMFSLLFRQYMKKKVKIKI